MKKFLVLVLVLSVVFMMAACGDNEKDDSREKSSKDNILVDLFPEVDEEIIDENTDAIVEDNIQENEEEQEYIESNWVEFDECFYGNYSNELPFDDGVDANGNTIWGLYDGTVKITKDYIYIDVPNAKYELTPENSRLFGDEYLSVNPNNEDWSFVIHNKENLQAGYKQIYIQTATNQYTLYKD